MAKVKIELTAAQVQQADNALRQIHDLLPQMDKLERCGIDCQERRDRLRQMADQLTNLKKEFGNAGA